MLDAFYANISPTASTIIAIAIILTCGFAMTRITKLLKLPSVTAYIVVGIIDRNKVNSAESGLIKPRALKSAAIAVL